MSAAERASRGDRRTTTQQGYGWSHQRLRAQWAPKVARGDVACWRCCRLIDPDGAWDLGHDDDDRSVYRGPEHVTCNRGTASRGRGVAVSRWRSEDW